MLRAINPQLSLHYWDWTQDPRAITNANLGGGATGTLNLFTSDFMGYGGSTRQPIGPPWQNAAAPWRNDGFYVPEASPDRDSSGNPADSPRAVNRSVVGSPASAPDDTAILNAGDYAAMRVRLENVHNGMHNFVRMGGEHISFRDPFVFLLHSNVDRLFARWQTDPGHPKRLDPNTVYGSESGDAGLNSEIRPWSGVPPTVRPWAPPENQQVAKNYKHPSVVAPPLYETNHQPVHRILAAEGKVTVLRVHDPDTGFGPPADRIDAEVVIMLDTLPERGLGFQLRADANEGTRRAMLDELRDAFDSDGRVHIEYLLRTGLRNGLILRVVNKV
jgi:hypothetical protein